MCEAIPLLKRNLIPFYYTLSFLRHQKQQTTTKKVKKSTCKTKMKIKRIQDNHNYHHHQLYKYEKKIAE